MRFLLPRAARAFALAAGVVLFLGSCARRDDLTADGRVIVQYWEKWSGFEADAMQAVIDDFNHSQNRIQVRLLSVGGVDTKLLLATASGHPPDVAGLWSENIPDFSEKGALTPLDGALHDAGLGEDHYIPLFWNLCRHRGFTWGLPTTPGCVALFYNKKLFRAAGLDPERPPRTLAELDDMARRLTLVDIERGGRKARVSFADLTPAEQAARQYTIVQVGHLPQDAGMFVSAWGCWFGAQYFDGGRRILADDAGSLAAYQWLHDTSATYGVENLRDFVGGFGVAQSAQSPFLGGIEAMVVQGPWMTNFIRQYAPGLEWGVAAFPAAPGMGGGQPVTVAQTDVVVIPQGARHPREAFEFIRYLQRQEVAEKLARAQQKFTALRETSPGFLRNHPNPAIGLFLQLARSPAARTVPRLPIWHEYDAELAVAAERVLNLRATPAEALAEVQSRVQWRWDRVMRRWDAVGAERLAEWRTHDRW
ncbi:MAG TPA: ABC transporter substrate-binding protein [Candidatus Didemnitutus sp.]|jgi:ABC-type glycerol-3-phosphate transport system substrate-binding protein